MSVSESNMIHQNVQEYYGKKLKTSKDLQTQACVNAGKIVNFPASEAVDAVHKDVVAKYYGCGLVIPEKLRDMKVLDLGSGSGRDCFALSKLVGQDGHVTGIDMTDEQIETSRKYVDYHTQKFGYEKPNIEFVQGYIEKMTESGFQENHFDIVISNCVINLCPDKKAIFREAYKVLKIGGEMYFSDVFTDSDSTEEIRTNTDLWGEGMSGALRWRDLYCHTKELGFSRPYLVSASFLNIENEKFRKILGDAKFVSATYRLFKVPNEKGEVSRVIYKGEIEGYEDQLLFEHNIAFKKDKAVSVGGDLVTVLQASRFSDDFDILPSSKEQNGLCNSELDLEQNGDPFLYIEEKTKTGESIETKVCSGGSI